MSEIAQKKATFLGIVPLLVFVLTFLGSGIYNNDFYALPSPIAAMIGIVAAFVLFKGSVSEKMDVFLKGCGDGKILTMCIIYLLAGAFATVSKASGSIDAIVQMGMDYISPAYFAAGVFVIASFLSFASGTSVGSIVTLAPVVLEMARQSHTPLGLPAAALLCGAMFGDNLSIISDTTIAATQSVGCEMRDKFRANFKLALPAALLAIALFVWAAPDSSSVQSSTTSLSYNPLLIVPYLLVILLAVVGVNVFVTLFLGLVSAGVLGITMGILDFMQFTKSSYEGFTSMSEIFFLSLLTGGLAALVDRAGGIRFILTGIQRIIGSERTALLGVGGLVSLTNLCMANNTISILISGKVSKEIGDNYALDPKDTASVLDIFACYVQGLVPYGAQILLLISFSSYTLGFSELFFQAYYLHLLLAITLLYILFKPSKKSPVHG